jgi:N-acetylated-alpha-linked acidic dipeptidase
VIDDVKDPETGVSLKERHYARAMVQGDQATRTKLLGNKTMKLEALGAGSDYSPFIQHLGVPSMNIGFGGESEAGVYHSIYYNYDHYTRFGDPGFQYGVALAKTAGRITLRLADADVLPFDFNSFYKTVAEYTNEVKTLADNKRAETEMKNKLAAENLFTLAKDPTKPYKESLKNETIPYLNFSSFENALQELKTSAEEFSKLSASALTESKDKQGQVNELLFKAEQKLLSDAGLPRRPWYKHEIYAPDIIQVME